MFSAAVVTCGSGIGADSEPWAPCFSAAAVKAGHLVSVAMSSMCITSPFEAAARQGPNPSSYWVSSRSMTS